MFVCVWVSYHLYLLFLFNTSSSSVTGSGIWFISVINSCPFEIHRAFKKKKKEILTIIVAFKLLYLHFVPVQWWIFQILHGNREVFQKQISCQIFAFPLQLLLRRKSTLSALGFVAPEHGRFKLMQMRILFSLWVYCWSSAILFSFLEPGFFS